MELTTSTEATVSLESVLWTDRLNERPSRPPDYQAENRALRELAAALADSPRTVLQKLVEVAARLCRADSAGVSLLSKHDGGKTFYWPAITGALSQYVGSGTPRDFGPCGIVLDRNSMQLFSRPERYYPYLSPITPPLEEVLLTPFYMNGAAVGTVWLVSHDPQRKFDAEDKRLIVSLGNFAAGAYQVLESLDALEQQGQVLRKSESRLRRMLNAEKVGVLYFCLDGRILDANPALEQMTGYTTAELCAVTDWNILTPPEFAEATKQAAGELVDRGQTQAYEKEWIRKDGSRFWGLFTPTRVSGTGRDAECVEFIIDITNRKAAEHALREREAWLAGQRRALEAALRGAPLEESLGELVRTAVDAMGENTRAAYYLANDEGTALHHVVGMSPEYAEVIDGFKVSADSLSCGLATSIGRPILTADVRCEPRWEAWLWAAEKFDFRGCWSFPIRTAAGKFIGTLAIYSRDPREATERDQDLGLLLTQTAAIIISRHKESVERQNAEAALQEADRRKNEFLAMLAHELRNPLAPIHNSVNVLRLNGSDGAAVAVASDMLERQVGQLVRLVDDLLDVSRISRGKIELKKERIELAGVLYHAVEAVQPLYTRMGHELTVKMPEAPIYLLADGARLTQVAGNLLTNAAKFTEPGGRIQLSVETEGDEQQSAIIRVRDNGIGISAEQLSRVFEIFSQVDTSLERSRDGLGIGLALVKNLVEMHDGRAEAQSLGLGQGSEFSVHLPIAKVIPDTLPEPAGSIESVPTPRRILVVDDNRDSATSLAMLLQLSGHTTLAAHDGQEAVEVAATFRPDFVLLDIGLPKMNGYEACRHIRLQPWSEGMILVALTGWGQEEDRQKSKDAGFDCHLVKPVDIDALTDLLSSSEPMRDAAIVRFSR